MDSMRVFLKSFGCSSNLADGEVLAGCLAKAGYILVNNVTEADLVIYNTCAVKGPTENRMISILKSVPKNKKLIAVGCLPHINLERLQREVSCDGVAGPALGERITSIVDAVLKGEKVLALKDAENVMPSLSLPRIRLNPVLGIIPVSYGCLGSCAYCCVVFARGRLRSYAVKEIVDKVRGDLAAGVKEFWLTSQDTACYGIDISTTLPELITSVCSIEGVFKVRVGMMTPNMALRILEGLVKAFENEKVFKFVHLPVQSGDNQVLGWMRRFYTVADFKRIMETFKTAFPKITIATDIICGFPGETAEAFENTLQMIRDVKPDIVNISKFFARPKTSAAGMKKQVPLYEIKERSTILASLAAKIAFERNLEWEGWEGEVLIDEYGKFSGSWVGRNFAYKPIVVKSTRNLLGKIVNIKVRRVFPTYLEGKLLE
ncbi:MAG: tRNA (N(6)-L-threonylcarbamoyladenosine(37)-C(2))-methylthiotransferase [Candidatus Bathyarchaeia archaeon]